jgi:hypothetical protein
LGIHPTGTPNRYVTFGGGRGWKRTFWWTETYFATTTDHTSSNIISRDREHTIFRHGARVEHEPARPVDARRRRRRHGLTVGGTCMHRPSIVLRKLY